MMASTTDNTFPTSASAADPGNLSGTSSSTGSRQSDLLNRVVQGAHQTIDRLAESAAPHVQRLEQGVTTASDTLHSRAGQARDMSDEWAESLRSAVRENPIAAVAAALAVGMLISRITS